MSKNVSYTTSEKFDTEVIKAELPVLVTFTASWCGPCRAMAPLIEQLADEYEGRLKVMKIDIDENPEVALQYRIRGVPTMMVFKKGSPAGTLVGGYPKAAIQDTMDKALQD